MGPLIKTQCGWRATQLLPAALQTGARSGEGSARLSSRSCLLSPACPGPASPPHCPGEHYHGVQDMPRLGSPNHAPAPPSSAGQPCSSGPLDGLLQPSKPTSRPGGPPARPLSSSSPTSTCSKPQTCLNLNLPHQEDADASPSPLGHPVRSYLVTPARKPSMAPVAPGVTQEFAL